jgi:hypothetical protein
VTGFILDRVNRALLLFVLLASSCVSHPIGTPAGDNNYDDPDDPGDPGQGNGGPDGSIDAYGQFCVAARDCPAAFVCAYPIADLCGGAGRCLPYDPDGGCTAPNACGCNNTTVQLCAPTGYAPVPIQSQTACDGGTPVMDAADDAVTTDAEATDSATDALSE